MHTSSFTRKNNIVIFLMNNFSIPILNNDFLITIIPSNLPNKKTILAQKKKETAEEFCSSRATPVVSDY